MRQGSAIESAVGLGDGDVSVHGGGSRIHETQPHFISVHLLRCMACSTTAMLAPISDTNIDTSVGVHLSILIILAFSCTFFFSLNIHQDAKQKWNENG
jgi:hypothetical protein